MKLATDVLGNFEQMVIAAVMQLGDNAYGRSVHRVVEEQGGRSVSYAAIYVTLDRLERKGYLKSWETEPTPERGGRSRVCYHVLKKGETALQEALEAGNRIQNNVRKFWRFRK